MITASQLRAARGLLDWSYEKLAEESGVSRPALMNVGTGKSEPQKQTLEKIISTFRKFGVEFIDNGVRWATDIVQIYEGEDCFLRLLDDAFIALAKDGGEFLTSGSDDRRSPPEVVEKLRSMRNAGIQMRSLIKNGDTYLMGPIEEYRWMDDRLFVDSDAKIIYGDVVAYLMSWLGTPRVVAIKDSAVAEDGRRTFDYIWDHSQTPTQSTSDILF